MGTSPRRSPLGRIWPPLAYLALGVLLTWPLAAHLGERLPGLGDAALQTWSLAWIARALATNPASVWDAPIFYPYGDSAAFQDHHLFQGALVAPLIWATGNPVLAHNVLALLSFALTGWAVYLLARDVAADASPVAPPAAVSWAAFAAGCAVAFSSYRIAHLVHLHLLQTAWVVLALLFMRRLLRPRGAGGWRWGDAALLGLFGGLQVGVSVYYGFFAVLVLAAYGAYWAAGALWRRVRAGEPLPWGLLPRLAVAAAIAATIAVPAMLPFLRVYRTLGIVRSLTELDNWSAPLRAYVSVVASNRLYGPLGEAVVDAGEMVLFPGLALAALGIIAVGMAIHDRRRGRPGGDVLFWALLSAGAALLSFGTALRLVRYGDPLPVPMPYPLLYTTIPGFGSLRVPARWGWLVGLGLAVLAAVALARLLARLRPPWRGLAGAAVAVAILAEHAAFPLPLSPPVLADVPPVYAWLGAPEQADLATVVELPVGETPRGAELDRIIARQLYGMSHWKNLPVAYGGLIPFGTSELLRRLQDLPDPAALDYLRLVGVDSLVLHRDEYDPATLAALVAGLEAAPGVSRRAEVGESLVYTLAPAPALDLAPGSVFVSADERLPGLPVLGLIRRWQGEGRALYGPGRVRFYRPLREPPPGLVADYGLLAAGEEPATLGYAEAGLIWEGLGLALYRRDPALLASLSLATPVPGQFHPRYPAAVELSTTPTGLRAGAAAVAFVAPAQGLRVELDVASLAPAELRVGDSRLALPAGLSTVGLALPAGAPLAVGGDPATVALLQLRALAAAPEPAAARAAPGLVAEASAALDGSALTVDVRGAGGRGVLLDVRGAAARDDRPIALLSGARALPPEGGEVRFDVDLLRPEAPWLTGGEAAQDGRYIVYIKDAGAPEGPGRPVAQFFIRDGRVDSFEAVPLPLTTVP